jgi:membrane-associated phospholipid phosphatase
MQAVIAMFACGLLAGVAGGALAWKWPIISAPRISAHQVLDQAEQRPLFARVLWSRVGAARLSSAALGAALLVALVGGAFMGVLFWMVRSNEGLARYDLGAARWAAAHTGGASTDILRAVSQLGGSICVIAVALITAAIASRRLRPRSVIAFLATVMVGESLLVALIKAAVNRARPDIHRLTGFSSASFPSGHAATAAATYAAVALLLGLGEDRRRQATLSGIAIGVAVSVAATRVLLGVHWLTDVLAGLALGWTWFAIVSIVFGGRLVRFAAPIEAAERAIGPPLASGPQP